MDLNALKPLIESKVSSLGYDLISLTSKKEGGDLILSIVIDKVEPIDMNMIVEVTNVLSSYLDEIDSSNEAYMLDISSLGAEKPLKVEELSKYEGRYINVHVNNAIMGENIFEGTLKKVNPDNIELEIRIKTRVKLITIENSNIYKIRLAIKF